MIRIPGASPGKITAVATKPAEKKAAKLVDYFV
jgi:hypothetical protein